MTPEQSMWQRLSPILHTFAIAQRHEDSLSPDIPDVSFTRRISTPYGVSGGCGWIELKTIAAWNKRCFTKLPHLRPGQVNWLKSRGALGADVWLLLWVRESNEWLWIPGKDLAHTMIDVGQPVEEWRVISCPQPFI